MAKFPAFAAVAALALVPLSAAQATTETYDISWTGTDGYSMTGVFSFDSSVGSQVRDYDVSSLSIDVFQNGVSLGTWTLPSTPNSNFNFNFDADTGSFDVGGNSTGDNGQLWNYSRTITGGAVGFASYNQQEVYSTTYSPTPLGLQNDLTALKATLVTGAVPEPVSWAMFIGGFGVLGATLRRRRPAFAAVSVSSV
jgi:hypothetical protein